MLSEKIRQYLISLDIEKDSKVTCNFAPAKEGIQIYDTGGLKPYNEAKIKYPTLQITTKYKHNNMDKIYEVYNALNGIYKLELLGTTIEYCEANQEPLFLKKEDGFFYYICNFTFIVI